LLLKIIGTGDNEHFTSWMILPPAAVDTKEKEADFIDLPLTRSS